MMIRQGRLVGTLAMAATLVVLASACEEDESGVDGAAQGSRTGAEPNASPTTPSSPPTATPTVVPTATPTAPTAEPSIDLTGSACLPGDWLVDNEQFAALIAGASGGTADEVTGSVVLTLGADGTSRTSYADWTHSITSNGATITITKDGTDQGTYEVTSGGTMRLVDTEINSTTTSRMEMGGQVVEQGVTAQPSVFSRASFTCVGDQLTVVADGGETILHRQD